MKIFTYKILHTLFYSWGSDAPGEAYWVAMDLMHAYSLQYDLDISLLDDIYEEDEFTEAAIKCFNFTKEEILKEVDQYYNKLNSNTSENTAQFFFDVLEDIYHGYLIEHTPDTIDFQNKIGKYQQDVADRKYI